MIDGRIMQAETQNPKDISQLVLRAQETHIPLLLLNLNLMKIPVSDSPELLQTIEAVAAAMGILESLKMIPYDLRNEMSRLPEDIAHKHTLKYNTIWNKHDGVPNEDLFDAVLE